MINVVVYCLIYFDCYVFKCLDYIIMIEVNVLFKVLIDKMVLWLWDIL